MSYGQEEIENVDVVTREINENDIIHFAIIENPPVALKTIQNTCDLLEKIHNGHDEKSIKKTAELRLNIRNKATTLVNAIVAYYRAENKDSVAQQKAIKTIKKIVSRQSAYTMLMRSIAYGFEDLFD